MRSSISHHLLLQAREEVAQADAAELRKARSPAQAEAYYNDLSEAGRRDGEDDLSTLLDYTIERFLTKSRFHCLFWKSVWNCANDRSIDSLICKLKCLGLTAPVQCRRDQERWGNTLIMAHACHPR